MGKEHWTSDSIPDQTGRVAIVTGANSGIGFEAAKALADKGADVIVASRNPQRGEAAVAKILEAHPKASVELMLLDLASLESVREFARRFQDSKGRLDLLLNNAGVMMPPKREETADGFELQIGTNHLGHFALTLPLLPLITSTDGSRIVNVSSTAQNFGRLDLDDLHWTKRSYRRMFSYGASKIANMLFSLELSRRLEQAGSGTIVASCHPGWTSTNLQKSSRMIRWLNPVFGMQPWQGALPTLYAAIAPDVRPAGYYGPDGLGTMRGYPTHNKAAKISRDTGVAEQLWTLSEQLVDQSWPELTDAAHSAN